ncbi:MAG: hypothetical protein HOL16_06405, partial [Alphaproteobacteria bacterium]|nr:hypothetical protein [Alphaproteobacteria bacterium]
NGLTTTGTGEITLIGSGISGTGVLLSATELTLTATGAVSLTGANNVTAIDGSGDTPTSFAFTNTAGNLDISGALVADLNGGITFTATGRDIAVSNGLTTTGTGEITLIGSGISGTGVLLSATELTLTATGAVSLTGANNVTALDGSGETPSSFSFTNTAGNLNISGALAADLNGGITFTATGRDIAVSNGLTTTGTGEITLIGAGISGTGVLLSATELTLTATGAVSLTGANNVTALDPSGATATSFAFTNSAANLALSGDLTVSGTASTDVLTLNVGANNLNFASNFTWTTTLGNQIYTADTVSNLPTGTDTLTASSGNITMRPSTLSQTIGVGDGATGNLAFTSAFLEGGVAPSGSLIIGYSNGTNTGALNVADNIGDTTALAYSMELYAPSITFSSGIALATTETMTLTANSGGITQSGGGSINVTAGTLVLSATGGAIDLITRVANLGTTSGTNTSGGDYGIENRRDDGIAVLGTHTASGDIVIASLDNGGGSSNLKVMTFGSTNFNFPGSASLILLTLSELTGFSFGTGNLVSGAASSGLPTEILLGLDDNQLTFLGDSLREANDGSGGGQQDPQGTLVIIEPTGTDTDTTLISFGEDFGDDAGGGTGGDDASDDEDVAHLDKTFEGSDDSNELFANQMDDNPVADSEEGDNQVVASEEDENQVASNEDGNEVVASEEDENQVASNEDGNQVASGEDGGDQIVASAGIGSLYMAAASF